MERREAEFLVAGTKKSCEKFTIIRLIFYSTIAQRSRRHIGKGANRQYDLVTLTVTLPYQSVLCHLIRGLISSLSYELCDLRATFYSIQI